MIARRIVLLLGVALLSASASAQALRVVHASVYTSNNKLVTGLEASNFAVVENGILRRLESLDHVAPVTTAVVGFGDFQAPANMTVLRVSSVAEALERLAGVAGRKAIVVAPGADTASAPSDVHVIADADVRHGLLVASNVYTLRYRSADPSAAVQVVLADVDGLPRFSVRWQ